MRTRKQRTQMKLLCMLLVMSMLLCACGAAADPGSATEVPKPTTPPPTEPPVIMIPSQDGLEPGVEYKFTGEYDTGAIGMAAVDGLLRYDGTYEVTASVWGYSTAITWGEWTYEDGKFLLTDSFNNLNLEAAGDGTTYSFTCQFSGTDIVMTATMTGTKPIDQLQVDPNPQQPTEPEAAEVSTDEDFLLHQVAAEDGFYAKFFRSGKFVIYQGIAQRDMATGTWEYDADAGLSVIIDDTPAEVTAADGNFTFLGVAMGFPREYVVNEAELAASIERDTPLEIPPIISDIYVTWSDEDWDAMWAEAAVPVVEKPNYTYPATKLDGTFESTLPREYFTPVEEEQRGIVKTLSYKTHIYAFYEEHNIPEDQWVPVEKQCYIYLPAGYDETKQYNTYYLMHGATGSEKDWFTMACDGTRETGAGDFVMMVDYLIANGLMEPTIFVSATVNTDVSHMDMNVRNAFTASHGNKSFPYELKNDLIPAVEGTYSTYAEDTTLEGLIASREHRAFAGLSLGAFVVWNTIAETNDVVAYYAPLANGCATGDDQSKDAPPIFDGLNDGYGVSFLFSSCGLKDDCLPPQENTFNIVYELGKDSVLTYGENCYNFNPENGSHTAKYFILGVYNSMKVFF